jgi:hypothetical protein
MLQHYFHSFEGEDKLIVLKFFLPLAVNLHQFLSLGYTQKRHLQYVNKERVPSRLHVHNGTQFAEESSYVSNFFAILKNFIFFN